MSINDHYVVKRWKKGEKWYVMRGRETFYDDISDEILLFDDYMDAVRWIRSQKLFMPISITVEVTKQEDEND